MKEEIGLSNQPFLSIKSLSYRYETDHSSSSSVISNISMDIEKESFVSVIGTSGSGKSTLFKLIAGLLQPQHGVITIENVDPSQRLGKVAYMPQKDLLLPWKNVADNILLASKLQGSHSKEEKVKIEKWLSRFGLAHIAHAFPHELSGGMKQRVAFLRTIMTGKDLLLLDEPFGALDALTKRNMHHWLLGMWEELKKTILFITHDLEEALLLSDKIFILPSNKRVPIKVLSVDFNRPRHAALIYDPHFVEKRKQLERLIEDNE